MWKNGELRTLSCKVSGPENLGLELLVDYGVRSNYDSAVRKPPREILLCVREWCVITPGSLGNKSTLVCSEPSVWASLALSGGGAYKLARGTVQSHLNHNVLIIFSAQIWPVASRSARQESRTR